MTDLQAPEAEAPAAGVPALTPAANLEAPEEEGVPSEGLGITFWLAAAWLAVVGICAAFASFLPVQDPSEIDVPNKLVDPFTEGHLLGTDGLGRDTLARLVFGARVSMSVGLIAVGVGLVAGGLLGVLAGYFRSLLDHFVVGVTSVMLAFPGLVILLALVAFLDRQLTTIATIVGLLSIPIYARVARANTLSVAERDYVVVARALGATKRRILAREVVPSVILPLVAFAFTAFAVIIVLEGSLAFLGLSVEPPTPTWGSMIAEGNRHIDTTFFPVLMPSLAMFLTVLSINFVGDTLRQRFSDVGAKL